MNGLVSIVVPLYNYAEYILDNIESVLNQTYPEIELIIVDDCSTDNPQKTIGKYMSKIKFVQLEKNMGYSVAKNEGIVVSSGSYIVVLDADDFITSKSIESRVNSIVQTGAKWSHGRAYEFSGPKPYKMTYHKRKYIRRFEEMRKNNKYKGLWQCMHAQTVMVKREVYEQVGLYEESLRSMSDKEMWARIQNNVGLPSFVDGFVACYRRHEKQMHVSPYKLKRLKSLQKALDNFVASRKKGDFTGIRRLP